MPPSNDQKDQVDLKGLSSHYHSEDAEGNFTEKDPFKLFDSWFNLARNAEGIKEPNAMVVATADLSGKPSVRYVLLKEYSRDGFCFSTNYDSRKGKEIAGNPQVALLFYWEPLCLQVRIEGIVEKIEEKESEELFHSRTRSAQLTALVSSQSTVIENREALLKKYQDVREQFADENAVIPRPNYWGGYKLIPTYFEFWSGRTSRLHDRMRFRHPAPGDEPDDKILYRGENGWVYEYLAP